MINISRMKRLPWRLSLGFLGVAVAVLGLGLVLHRHAARATEAAAAESLRATVSLGAESMDAWFSERLADVDVLADSQLLQRALDKAIADPARSQIEVGAILDHLDDIRTRYHYQSVGLVDASDASVLFSRGDKPDQPDIASLLEGARVSDPSWVELPPNARTGHYRAAVARRVRDEGVLSHVVLYLQVDPVRLVKTLHASQPINWTGTSLLLHRRLSQVQRFSSARDLGSQTLSLSAPDEPSPLEAQLLDQEGNRVDECSRDGTPVLAIRKDLVLANWYLIGMLDKPRLYASLREQVWIASVAYVVLMALIAIGLLAWHRGETYRQALRETGMIQFYDKILRQGDAIFILSDWRGKVIDASDSALAAFRYEKSDLVGLSVMALVPEAGRNTLAALARGMVVGSTRSYLGERLRSDGSIFLIEGSVGLIEIDGHRYFHSVGKDVTQQKETETRLRLAASVFDLLSAAIVICDANERILSANPAFTKMTGYRPDEVIGQPITLLDMATHPENRAAALAQLKREGYWEGELLGRRKNGTIYPRKMLLAVHRNSHGEVDQYFSIFTDLTQLRNAQKQAQHLAEHEPMTGLPNRKALDRKLPELLGEASKNGGSLTLAVLNLDRFSSINASLGIAEGDTLLRAIATRLEIAFRPGHLFHQGGDEFVVLLDGTPVSQALTVSQTLQSVGSPVALGPHTLSVSASAGLASFPAHADEASSLLRNASAALRMAKAQGGHTWRLYTPQMNASAYDDMLLAVELRAAIDKGELELYMQPQVRTVDGTVIGMEALLRWNHAQRGFVSPARFIPVAESSGLILELSTWVLNEACRLWSQWHADGLCPPPMAVNVSALQFEHPEFLDKVAETMSRFAIPSHSLVLELTEGLVMDNSETAIATMQGLVAMGVQLALDDFGTGYSSLSYLMRFPLEKLKIDRSFILNLGTASRVQSEAIVQAVVSMAKSLKLRVIAEGVETQEQKAFLFACGCDEIQGFLYYRPMPQLQVTELLRSLCHVHRGGV
jgi:diguanylate cyclase (GGDEF)-like protein/PAS domain S-box-containing protein